MKKLLALLLLLGIFGCGPSSEEKERIASVTCSIIKETKNFQSSERVEKINEARAKIKLPPYLDGDAEIIRSLNFNTCELLVKNDESYFEKTNQLEKLFYAELERLAAEKKAEEERLAAEKKAEEERLATLAEQERERLGILKEQQRLEEKEELRELQLEIDNRELSFFILRVHLLSSEDNANKMVAQIIEGGFPAFFEIDSDKNLYEVFVGPFIEETDITDNIDLIQKVSESNSTEISRWKL
jgi:predicted DNA-binding ribbon-helix-helix protein